MDLQKLIDEISIPKIPNIYLPPIIYDQNVLDTPDQVNYLLKQINKSKNKKNHNMVLYYAYTIGKIVEEETRCLQRKACLQKLEGHYRKVTKRLACLFDQDREPLLMTCKYFTLTNLSLMNVKNYKKLLDAAEGATTSRMLAAYSLGLDNSTEKTSEEEIIDVSPGPADNRARIIESLEESSSQEDLESLERESCNPESQD